MQETLFLNPTIDIGQLPHAEQSERNPLSSTYLKIQFLGLAITMAILVAPGLIMMGAGAPSMAYYLFFAGWGLLLILRLIIIPLGFKKKSYSIRDKDITYRSGLLWHSVTTIPFQRVQHCEVNRGPLDQLFGLASLKVYTAGGGSTDLQVPGLSPEDAEQMKSFILKQISGNDQS